MDAKSPFSYEIYTRMESYTLSGVKYLLPVSNPEAVSIIENLRRPEVTPEYARNARELLIANYARLFVKLIISEIRKGLVPMRSLSLSEIVDEIFVAITCERIKTTALEEDAQGTEPLNVIETVIQKYDPNRAAHLTTFITLQARRYIQIKLSQMFFCFMSADGSTAFYLKVRKANRYYQKYTVGRGYEPTVRHVTDVLLSLPEYRDHAKHVAYVAKLISDFNCRLHASSAYLDSKSANVMKGTSMTGTDYYRNLLPHLIGYEKAIKLYTYYKVALPLSWSGGGLDNIVTDFLSLPARKRRREVEKIKRIAKLELQNYLATESCKTSQNKT